MSLLPPLRMQTTVLPLISLAASSKGGDRERAGRLADDALVLVELDHRGAYLPLRDDSHAVDVPPAEIEGEAANRPHGGTVHKGMDLGKADDAALLERFVH